MVVGAVESVTVCGTRLECRHWGPPSADAPTLVLLHEGLGSVGLWRDFPQALAAETGMGVFAYSRAGYGGSDPRPLPWPLSYMEDEAEQVLPPLLDTIGFRRGLLIGHSDGASIAALHAGRANDPRVKGCVLMAPHFFVEPLCLDAIRLAKAAFEGGDLHGRLQRHHGANVDCAFYGWNASWLATEFRSWDITTALSTIEVPLLVLQGLADPYGTAVHAESAQERCRVSVDVRLMEGVGHAPWREAREETLDAISRFAAPLLVQRSPS
jgi:pimeloyl-ACP methyl ester carboxylesterase